MKLREELDFLTRCLEIQKARLGDRLQFSFDVEPGALSVVVPSLILQPAVENAILHGVAQEEPLLGEPKLLREKRLEVEVRDDGPGLVRGGPVGCRKGIWLSNTPDRLTHRYGKGYRLPACFKEQMGKWNDSEFCNSLSAKTDWSNSLMNNE